MMMALTIGAAGNSHLRAGKFIGADHAGPPLSFAGNRFAPIHPRGVAEDQAEGVTNGVAKDIRG